MFVYNLSLTLLFWVILSTLATEVKSLYSFANLSFSPFYVALLTVLLCSMAGVPPFVGFFSKLFIITLLVSNSFFLIYSMFFTVLFISLYFYMQNLRFLHSTHLSSINIPFSSVERVIPALYYTSITVIITLSLGVLFIDDILLVFTWLLK